MTASSPLSELFATEHAHVRMLNVLQMVFSKPMERDELLTSIELDTIFPSLDEIIEMHCERPCRHFSTRQKSRTHIGNWFSPADTSNQAQREELLDFHFTDFLPVTADFCHFPPR